MILNKILLVDDDKSIRELLETFFSFKFPDTIVYCAENGALGWEICQSEQPDLIISDIEMPGMNGIQLLVLVQEKFPETKVLMMSGRIGDKYPREDVMKLGAVEAFLKPISIMEISNIINGL
jgi:two-component system, response regulator YesN